MDYTHRTIYARYFDPCPHSFRELLTILWLADTKTCVLFRCYLKHATLEVLTLAKTSGVPKYIFVFFVPLA